MMLYVVTTSDGKTKLSRTKRIRNAVSAVTHYEYMRQHGLAIYELWIAALRTKSSLRSLRWVDPTLDGVRLVGRPNRNTTTTYVEQIRLFIGHGVNDPIVEELLQRSMNAREKEELHKMLAQAQQV